MAGSCVLQSAGLLAVAVATLALSQEVSSELVASHCKNPDCTEPISVVRALKSMNHPGKLFLLVCGIGRFHRTHLQRIRSDPAAPKARQFHAAIAVDSCRCSRPCGVLFARCVGLAFSANDVRVCTCEGGGLCGAVSTHI